MSINSEELKSVMRNWTSGGAVVTSFWEGTQHGMTVNSFTSVSIDPALVVVTLANNTRTCQMVKQSRLFGVTILSGAQREMSDQFSGKVKEEEDRFSDIKTFHLKSSIPYLVDGLGWLECSVKESIDLGFSTLFIAEVINTGSGYGDPLLYHNRDYYRLGEKYD